MGSKEKKKTPTIFDLYNQEKCYTLKDDTGKELQIKMVKMDNLEHTKCKEVFNEALKQQKALLVPGTTQYDLIDNLVSKMTKEELVDRLCNQEQARRELERDLLDVPDSEGMSQDELRKAQDTIIADWIDKKRRQWEKKSVDELRGGHLNDILETAAMIRANADYELECVSFMCRDPKTDKRLFSSREDVKRLKSDALIEELKGYTREINAVSAPNVAREVANSSDF